MIILLSRIVPRDPESAVLCYQQAAHRHQFAQLPQRHCQTNWTGLVGPTIKRPQAAS